MSRLFRPDAGLPILWEDTHFAILNKPSGLAAHPGPRTQDSVETRLAPQKRGGPWLVHRLDRDTSGCLLVAKRKTALIAAQKAFMDHKLRKIYWAIAEGPPPSVPSGEIINFVRQYSTREGGWQMEFCLPTARNAAKAHTSWRLLGHGQGKILLELVLHTGRTHQARLHCASLGMPILGDRLYNPAGQAGYPLQLLAQSLMVFLEDGRILKAIAPPEPSMAQILAGIT